MTIRPEPPAVPLLAAARRLWENVAGVPASFPPAGAVNVVVSPQSDMCPAGWVGIVELGGSALVTAPAARGRGLARRVASAAVAHALADRRLPQWRARPPASRRVAAALGFEELGAQLSLDMG
ncbi:GNAT family N-acetyltransferase [Streptomyces sp. NPDC006482]|uniref:GNAT family N-acetyltransferase n=1 Tax=Streptomyces sp. NPDC006482 TaxID=3154306 RepID=UPI00339EE6D1